MTQLETDILRTLQSHRGHSRAIKVATLAEWFEVQPRKIEDAIKHLTEDDCQPIAMSRREPYGAFLVVTTEEADEYEAMLSKTAKSTFARLRGFRAAVDANSEQGRLL